MGPAYLLTAMISFTVLGISYKLSDHLDCNKEQTNLCLFICSGIIIAAWAWRTHAFVLVPSALALGCASGGITYFAIKIFREAVAKGKLSTSWVILQLSLVIPVMASAIIWHEIPGPRQLLGLGVTASAIVLIGVDMRRSDG